MFCDTPNSANWVQNGIFINLLTETGRFYIIYPDTALHSKLYIHASTVVEKLVVFSDQQSNN